MQIYAVQRYMHIYMYIYIYIYIHMRAVVYKLDFRTVLGNFTTMIQLYV